jgi:GntR family transcriptional regulator/MocR family aminotransferase
MERGEVIVSTRKSWASLYTFELDRTSDSPLFRQIYAQIRSSILTRTLRPTTKLPSTRELARELAVSRTAVVSAYEQLLAEGYVTGRVGAGTYVASDLPEAFARVAPERKTHSASSGRSIAPSSSAHVNGFNVTSQGDERPFNLGRTLVDARTIELWRKLTARSLRTFGRQHLGYSDPQGMIELRRHVCEYLRAARAVRCEPEQIVITAGTQQAIDIVARLLPEPHKEVWVEDPGYPLTRQTLAAAGSTVRAIPVDKYGIDVNAGTRLAPRASAVFITPSHQFPKGVQLSMSRRLELLSWAQDSGAWIVEDDYASEFRYGGRPLASLQGLDVADRVIYIGTLNKALFPGLRLGYAVLPPSLLRPFTVARHLMDRQPPSLCQTVLCDFMAEGHFASHIRRMRSTYQGQRDMLVSALHCRLSEHLKVEAPDQGMHLVAYTRRGLSDVVIERTAREKGIIIRSLSRMYVEARRKSGLMLGFSGFPRQTIGPAVIRLAAAIAK